MPSIKDRIIAPTIKPIKKLYIKRRLFNDTYESNWQRVDIINGQDIIINWGAVSYSIDPLPSTSSTNSDISGVTITVSNINGFFNKETQVGSFFYPSDVYLTRSMSKIRITVSLEQDDMSEYGETVMFEGFIEQVVTSENQTATIKCIAYTYIFKQYSISDMGFTSTSTLAGTLLNSILNQVKITSFFDVSSISILNNPLIQDPSKLQGDYWEIIQKLVYLCGACIVFNCSAGGGFIWGQFNWGEIGAQWGETPDTARIRLKIVPRQSSGSTIWNLKGIGNDKADVLDSFSYDDEGATRIVTRWEEEGGTLYAETGNITYKKKYKIKPYKVKLDDVALASRQSVLNTLLSIWESPKPSIKLLCIFMMNYIKVGDTVTYQNYGKIDQEEPSIWGKFTWGSFVWSEPKGAVLFPIDQKFFVTDVSHDFESLTTTLRLEIA